MKKSMRMILALVLALVTLMSIPAMAAKYNVNGEPTRAKVLDGDAVVYSKANVSSSILRVLRAGKTVKVDAIKGNWARVVNGNRVGFIKMSHLLTEDPFDIVKTRKATTINAFRVSGKTVSKTMKVSAGKTLYVFGYDTLGNLLVGNRAQTYLGYIAPSAVKTIGK